LTLAVRSVRSCAMAVAPIKASAKRMPRDKASVSI